MINLIELKAKFSIEDSEIFQKSESIFLIEKYLWDYEKAHQFQLYCVEKVLENPKLIFLIITSHPNILTMGRGLQKLKNSNIELIEFDPKIKSELSIDVIDIKRGGGLTFHHDGQFVFYPILKTTEHNLKVHDLMIEILEITKTSLGSCLNSNELNVNKELLGLWYKQQYKLASIGLAVNRFVTYHGLALNFFENIQMKNEIEKLFPCGLPGNVYTSVEKINEMKTDRESFNKFKALFLNTFYEIIERHKSSEPIFECISSTVSDENRAAIVSKTESSLS